MSKPSPLSVQLYSLRDALSTDFEGVIRKVADIGYAGVEPYGGLPAEPADAAKLFKELGLQVTSAHLPVPLGDDKQKGLEAADALGIQWYVVPWQPPETFASADSVKKLAETLNEASAVVKAAGMQLAYHNHDFEFQAIDGKMAYSLFRQLLSPDVLLQVDTYWVKVGGYDAAELVKELGHRAPILHIKDGPAVRGEPMVAVGDGVMDVPAIVKAGEGVTQWLIVELDACATDMMEAVKKSYHYMIEKGLARGREG